MLHLGVFKLDVRVVSLWGGARESGSAIDFGKTVWGDWGERRLRC